MLTDFGVSALTDVINGTIALNSPTRLHTVGLVAIKGIQDRSNRASG